MLLLLVIVAIFLIGFWAPRHSHLLQRFLSAHLGRYEQYWRRAATAGSGLIRRAIRVLHLALSKASEEGRKLRDRAPF